MNESEKQFCKNREKTLEHYGVEIKDGVRYSVIQKQRNMLSLMGFLEGMVNPERKTRLIVDYDPDFKEALLQIIEGQRLCHHICNQRKKSQAAEMIDYLPR